jgi:hypothetical protein
MGAQMEFWWSRRYFVKHGPVALYGFILEKTNFD